MIFIRLLTEFTSLLNDQGYKSISVSFPSMTGDQNSTVVNVIQALP